jgi:membrane associated rhomboid family serine protease
VPSVCYRHPDRETFVSCTRCERPICPECMKPASVGFQCPACVKEGAATVRTPQAAYGGKAVAAPAVTFTLIGLNVLVFLVTTASGTGLAFGGNPSSLFEKLALAPTVHCTSVVDQLCQAKGVAQGEYWRLLTSTFLHFGVVHIALNMYCLFLLGPALETAFGRLRFTALYLLSGLSGAALSYALGPANEQAAGASGAVFGLFAAYYVLQRQRGGDVTQIALTIGINLAISFGLSSYIDWRGHVGGLVGGALVAAAFVYAPPGARRGVYQGLGALAVAGLVVVVVAVRTAQLTA